MLTLGVGPLGSPAGEAAAAPDQDDEGERLRRAAPAVPAPITGKDPGAALLSSTRRCQGLSLIREAELKNSNGENLVEMRARLAELIKERQRLLKQYRVWRSKGRRR